MSVRRTHPPIIPITAVTVGFIFIGLLACKSAIFHVSKLGWVQHEDSFPQKKDKKIKKKNNFTDTFHSYDTLP